MHNDKGTRWLVVTATAEFPFSTIVDYSSAEDARKAATLENAAAKRVIARVYRDTPGRSMEEIQV